MDVGAVVYVYVVVFVHMCLERKHSFLSVRTLVRD